MWVDGELHVRAAGVHANFTQHSQACIAQNLVFLVRQGLGRGHGDRVAGVHAHGVEVFNRAHDDAVVRFVAHHFHLVLFPTQQRFFNQQFIGGRGFQTALANGFELFRVVGDAPTSAAQGEAGPNNDRKTHCFLNRPSIVQTVRDARTCGTQTNLGHGVFELQAVFGFVNGFWRGTNQLDGFTCVLTTVLVQHAVVPQVQCTVQCGLTAHGGQNGIGAFFGNDFFNRFPGDRFDVSHIGRRRIGHDRGRVAVDQNNFKALFTQGFAGLHTRVIEFTGLTNDDGARANQENAFDVCALRHGKLPPWIE